MKVKVKWTDLTEDCFPEEIMLGEHDEALNTRIKEKVMIQIQEGKHASRKSRKVFRLIALAAAVAVLFTVSAYAAGLFNQKFTKASGTVSGEWIWRNEDGSVEVQKMEYPEAGYILTADETGSIPNRIELKANWLPSNTENVGKWGAYLHDDGGFEGPVPYGVAIFYAIPGFTAVLNGDVTIVKEENWGEYKVTELTASWHPEYGLGVQNFVLLQNEEHGYLISIGGGDDFETLEHIARELEVRDTGEPVEYNPDFNIGIMNVGRG